ncbi:MAG: ASCH domain-containing protein [bacterium]|nr:ASCH domain-containing protein [bacterium]
MSFYKSHRQEPHFSNVKEGKKVIEVRLRKGKYAEVKAGDIFEVQRPDESESFRVKVVGTTYYNSFKKMAENENFKEIIPEAKDVSDVVKACREFYSEEQEKEFGVVALRVKVL